jgi:hypothetical protein
VEELFASGRIVDVVVVFMTLEAVALLAYRWMWGRGLVALDIASVLAPGLFLLLALRAALSDAPWPALAAWLLAALLAHLADLWRRSSQA